MKTIRTVRCKIGVSPEDLPLLFELFRLYAAALSEIAQWGRDHQEANSVRLHHALYRGIREKYRLPANLAVTALRRASGALKAARLRGKFLFRSSFVALDERTLSLWLEDEEVTIATHEGRRRAKLILGDYQRRALGSGIPKSATLVRAREGLYLNIVVKGESEEAPGEKVLGVDLGIRNIAATSSGKFFDGTALRYYRKRCWVVRASLQSNGTRGARKVLRRLSGREARHASAINHRIAKAIVLEARETGCARIALEDLSGIRERLRVRNPHRNRMMSLWSYGQLREFVRYKAVLLGILVVEVPAFHSSQTCGACGKPGERRGKVFICASCGRVAQADVNAAQVIAARGAAVNRPGLDGQASRNAS